VTQPWQCESLRLSALWSSPEGAESALSWESVVGAPPEVRESQPRQGTTRDAGPINDGATILELRTAPGRADWLLLPAISTTMLTSTTFPNVGNVDEALHQCETLLFEKAARSYSVPRFALGLTAIYPAADRDASYALLTKKLKTIRPDLVGASEFLYQINRPRQSKAVPGLTINRLSRWGSVVLTGVIMPQAPNVAQSFSHAIPSKQIHAMRAELDLNSGLEQQTPIRPDDRLELLRELARLGPEILADGDVP
jgi:hypothetical protein